jgi:hypothetical protein
VQILETKESRNIDCTRSTYISGQPRMRSKSQTYSRNSYIHPSWTLSKQSSQYHKSRTMRMWLPSSGILRMWHYQTQPTETVEHGTRKISLRHNLPHYAQQLGSPASHQRSPHLQFPRCRLSEEVTLQSLTILPPSRPSRTIPLHRQLPNP